MSISNLDSETEQLIEQLTQQLQTEKLASQNIRDENESLKLEIIQLEHEITDRNRKLQYLRLSNIRKEPSFLVPIEGDARRY